MSDAAQSRGLVAWRGSRPSRDVGRGIGAWLMATLVAERDRWPLWAPVGVATGIGIYFALSFEPPLAFGLALAGAVASVAAVGPRASRPLALAAFTLALGFAVAQLRTAWVAAPILERAIGPTWVSGRVVANRANGGGRRLLLERVRIQGLDRAATPARVRLRAGAAATAIAPGQWVRLRAKLRPPPEPAVPGAYDFARRAYFERLGGVGFAFGAVTPIAAPAGAGKTGWATALARFRDRVTARLRDGLPGQAGAVAAALLTGERGAIGEPVLAAMRDAGLAHLLAISGLHMGLVAVILFAATRLILALVEPLALRYPTKKWAAAVALVGTLGYLLLAGAPVPTQRAFVMSAIVILAIIVDRQGVSMRTVAWAALALLLTGPESLLGASFQLSFAAVIGLVAAFEGLRERLPRWRLAHGLGGRVLIYAAGVALTTIVATLATAPFAIQNFDRVAAYGLAANLIAVPIAAHWIMPWGLAALALMPFGLEHWALTPMGWGIDAIIAVAERVASWPGAVRYSPAMPVAGVILAAAGGLWLCLWRRRWRWLGLPLFVAGLVLPLATRQPDLWLDRDGKLFGLRQGADAVAVSRPRTARFAADIWRRRNGVAALSAWPEGIDGLACDPSGCIWTRVDATVALVRDPRALFEDCRQADIVVALVPVRVRCPSAAMVVDRFDLWRKGAHALYIEPGGARLVTVADSRGDRPWTRRRRPRR